MKPKPTPDTTALPAPTTEKKARFGRPMKLTPELIEKVAAVVRTGCYLDTAARFCGVSKVSFHEWMKKGHEQKRGLYRDFLNALEEAQAFADVRDHQTIAKASSKDWKAAETHLRLRNPGRYGVKRTELTGADGKAIEVKSSVEASLIELFTKLASDESTGESDGSAGD